MSAKIAIIGGGVAGLYLARLYEMAGVSGVEVYDKTETTGCTIASCAWMVPTDEFVPAMERIKFPAARYLLRLNDVAIFRGVRVKARLWTINKPLLLKDLREIVRVTYGTPRLEEYDVVVDATGVARAFLPPAVHDVVCPTVQYRVKRSFGPHYPEVRFVKAGYAWDFPLNKGYHHVGCGSLVEDPTTALMRSGLYGSYEDVKCTCTSAVRLAGPAASMPFNAGNVWGVGESIGTVSPLVGDGICPSMRCAQIFFEEQQIGTLNHYPARVLEEFAWMDEERPIVDRLRAAGATWPGLRDARVLLQHGERFGFKFGLRSALSLFAKRG